MKKILAATILFLATPVFADIDSIPSLPMPKSSETKIDRIIAIVNNQAISQSELDNAVAQAMQQIQKSNMTAPSEQVLRQQILEQLINQKLQLQLADRFGLKASPEQIDETLNKIAKHNNITLAELKQKLASDGYSIEDFRKQIGNQIIVSQLQQQAAGKDIKITPQEVKDYIKKLKTEPNFSTQYHVVDILIPTPDSATAQQIEEAKKSAEKIASQIKSGVDFDSIAGDKSSDFGWRTLDQLPTVFANVVVGMKLNSISAPIKAGNGFHIIKLLGIKKSGASGLPNETQVQQILYQQKLQIAVKKWMEEVRKQSYIKIVVPQ